MTRKIYLAKRTVLNVPADDFSRRSYLKVQENGGTTYFVPLVWCSTADLHLKVLNRTINNN